jgi:hypothetical protein
MSPFETISDAVHELSYDEKLKLRTLLDSEIKLAASANGQRQPGKSIIGLFSDEPELIDDVLHSVYERRSRPLQIEE